MKIVVLPFLLAFQLVFFVPFFEYVELVASCFSRLYLIG